MFCKAINFRSVNAAYSRGAYYVAGDIKSHIELRKLDRWFLGTGVRGVYSLHAAAVAAERRWRSKPGARREYSYVEVILSTPAGVDLDKDEDRFLAARIVDDFQCVAAMVGAHWHKEGRVDIHVLLLNETVEGLALGTCTVLPSTGRIFRNVEVLARQFADSAHDALNLVRERAGRPRIQPMEERQSELYRLRAVENEKRIDELVRRSAAFALLLKRPFVRTAGAVAVTAKRDVRLLDAEINPSTGEGLERRTEVAEGSQQRSAPAETPTAVEQWFQLTVLLHRWAQLMSNDADDARVEKELSDRARWFVEREGLTLRPEIDAALALACERCVEDAREARETLVLVRDLAKDWSHDAERDHGLDHA